MKCFRNKVVTICAAVFLLCIDVGLSNTDTRHWQMASGEEMFAELVSYDLETKIAQLRIDNREMEYPLDAFAPTDQSWLIEWAEFSHDLESEIEHMEGTFAHYQTQDHYQTDYYVYFPSDFSGDTELPMLVLLHPGGKGARYVQRFMEAGEMLGVIIVSTDDNRNTGGDDDFANNQQEQFKELMITIDQSIPYDRSKLYLGGTSGGGLRALYYTARIDRPWAGVFSNGGWLGSTNHWNLPYPAGMRVAMVNGNSDRAANHYVDRDTKKLQESGCEVGLYSFEGGHQVPPPVTQVKALEWMMRLTDEIYHSPVVSEPLP